MNHHGSSKYIWLYLLKIHLLSLPSFCCENWGKVLYRWYPCKSCWSASSHTSHIYTATSSFVMYRILFTYTDLSAHHLIWHPRDWVSTKDGSWRSRIYGPLLPLHTRCTLERDVSRASISGRFLGRYWMDSGHGHRIVCRQTRCRISYDSVSPSMPMSDCLLRMCFATRGLLIWTTIWLTPSRHHYATRGWGEFVREQRQICVVSARFTALYIWFCVLFMIPVLSTVKMPCPGHVEVFDPFLCGSWHWIILFVCSFVHRDWCFSVLHGGFTGAVLDLMTSHRSFHHLKKCVCVSCVWSHCRLSFVLYTHCPPCM